MNIRAALLSAARSRANVGDDAVDLCPIHGPVALRSHDALAEALATAHAEGIVRAVGVSNYSAKETSSIDAALHQHDLRLASNQIESPCCGPCRSVSGSSAVSRARGRAVGLLADRAGGPDRQVSAANPPPKRPRSSAHPMAEVDKVVALLRHIGAAHGDRTPARWRGMAHREGTSAHPPRQNQEQAQQKAGALGWRLTGEELDLLSSASL